MRGKATVNLWHVFVRYDLVIFFQFKGRFISKAIIC